jgi:hypothetical protein
MGLHYCSEHDEIGKKMDASAIPLDLSIYTKIVSVSKNPNDKQFHQQDKQVQEKKANLKKSKKALLAKLAFASGDPTEFMRQRALERLRRAGRADKVFAKIDVDGNGFVDFEELKLALSDMGCALKDAEVRQLLLEADTDGDRLIRYVHFNFRSRLCISLIADSVQRNSRITWKDPFLMLTKGPNGGNKGAKKHNNEDSHGCTTLSRAHHTLDSSLRARTKEQHCRPQNARGQHHRPGNPGQQHRHP